MLYCHVLLMSLASFIVIIINVCHPRGFYKPTCTSLSFYAISPLPLSPLTNQPERVHGEIYTSDAFFEETENVRQHSPVPDDSNCTREKVVVALMVASDETHLTDFGNTKAWLIYLMLGNLSKYIHSQPNSGAMHHLAYIPAVCIGCFFLNRNDSELNNLLASCCIQGFCCFIPLQMGNAAPPDHDTLPA